MRTPRLFAGLLAGTLLSLPAQAQDYVAVDNNGGLIAIDAVTGCLSAALPAIPGVTELNAMARRPSDGHLFVAGAWNPGTPPTLHEIDPANNYALVSSTPLTGQAAISIRGMAFDSAGTLYAASWASPGCHLLDIDPATGVCTLVGVIGASASVQALAWDEANGRLVGWDNWNAAVGAAPGLVHIDPQTAVTVDPSPANQGTAIWEVQGLTFDRDGKLMTVGGVWRMQELDPLTGAVLWSGNCTLPNYLRGVEDVRPRSLKLVLGGSCPGLMTVDLSSGTPGALAAIAYAFGNAGFTVPNGPCAGTVVQLSAPATLLGLYVLDAQGAFTLGPLNVPANACGNVWVQAIDLANCQQTAALQP